MEGESARRWVERLQVRKEEMEAWNAVGGEGLWWRCRGGSRHGEADGRSSTVHVGRRTAEEAKVSHALGQQVAEV